MKNNINHTGQVTALMSFIIGTSLLALYLYFGHNFIPLGFALAFIIIAIIVNSVLFIAIIGTTILRKTYQLEALKTCGLMLLNIPIAILYFYMVVTFPYQNMLL
ncbi:hypothetical protein [Psychroserpens jangbogonensis]|uniref:hypothetical protein n=1 Tax=Psychroserpens jangbogonensis TaxID=1484460 RepID=UPI00053EBDF8|nr:hypothetical protein [Psychroserpens jangbogonensis]